MLALRVVSNGEEVPGKNDADDPAVASASLRKAKYRCVCTRSRLGHPIFKGDHRMNDWTGVWRCGLCQCSLSGHDTNCSICGWSEIEGPDGDRTTAALWHSWYFLALIYPSRTRQLPRRRIFSSVILFWGVISNDKT